MANQPRRNRPGRGTFGGSLGKPQGPKITGPYRGAPGNGVPGPPGVRGNGIPGAGPPPDSLPGFEAGSTEVPPSRSYDFPLPGIPHRRVDPRGGPAPMPKPIFPGGAPPLTDNGGGGGDTITDFDAHGRPPTDPNYMRGTFKPGTWPGPGSGAGPGPTPVPQGGGSGPLGGPRPGPNPAQGNPASGGFQDWWKGGGNQAHAGFGYSPQFDQAEIAHNGAEKHLLHQLYNQGMGQKGLNSLIQDPRLLGSLQGPGGGYNALMNWVNAGRGNINKLGQFAQGWQNQPGHSSPFGQTANQNAAYAGLPGFYNQYTQAMGTNNWTPEQMQNLYNSPYWSQNANYYQGPPPAIR